MTLAANAVHHAFGPREVLRDVSVALTPGESVALLGPNGAGKTTLARILTGVLAPSSGEVTLDGRALNERSPTERARHISVVPQARPAAFGFSALELVLMGFHARNGKFSLETQAQQQLARDALDKLEVGELAERSMTQLSSGEAQRVIMARTLVSGTTYWLLDEPTSNLDLRHQLALLDHVRDHCASGGAALAIVHDPNLAERYFDRVLVLHEGGFIADGAPSEVLDADVFRRAFGLGMQYVGDRPLGAWVPEFPNIDPSGGGPVSKRAFDSEPGN